MTTESKIKLNLQILLIRGGVYAAADVAWWVVDVVCCLMLLLIETWKEKMKNEIKSFKWDKVEEEEATECTLSCHRLFQRDIDTFD